MVNGVTLRWMLGRDSALDTHEISEGREVGKITATKFGPDEPDGPVKVPYFVDFAFA